MPVLRFQDTVIPYEIRRNSRSKGLRITVRPGRVLVTAPRHTPLATITAFVESKRLWIHEKSTAVRRHALATLPSRFTSGARIVFRGRKLALRIDVTAGQGRTSLRFANGFRVRVPPGLTPNEIEKQARGVVMNWLVQRALEDAELWAREYGAALGVQPSRIRIGNQRTLWGSCSARGVIALNWRLVALPKPLFEYVMVHELCHLREHNHSRRFWDLVESLLPDYRARRTALKRCGVALD